MLTASRILACTGVGLTQVQGSNLYWLRMYILMHAAGRSILEFQLNPTAYFSPLEKLSSALIIACFFGGLLPGYAKWMTKIVAVLVGLQIFLTLPFTANHIFLEFVCLALLALLDESEEHEGELLLQALRWFTISFFFYSGLQKVLYGRYFDGQFLGYMITGYVENFRAADRFANFLRFFMPAAEFDRLRALGPEPKIGDGPFSVNSTLFMILTNSVYVFEMLAPIFLLIKKARPVAVLLSIGFVLAIEAGARELVFGALMINLLLIFFDGAWNKRLFPLFAIMYAYLIAAAFLDWVPMFEYAPN